MRRVLFGRILLGKLCLVTVWEANLSGPNRSSSDSCSRLQFSFIVISVFKVSSAISKVSPAI